MTMHDDAGSELVTSGASTDARRNPVIEVRDLVITIDGITVVKRCNLRVIEKRITVIIGSSGCGKSTLLRHLNRLNDFTEGLRFTGDVLFHGQSLYTPDVDAVATRRRIGMVFQKPTPFTESIYENIAWGPRLTGQAGEPELPALVEDVLRQANLWDEVADRLDAKGTELSVGQQQRLCIARALAMRPEVLLLDEPTSALDTQAVAAIDELLLLLKANYTIVVVTHDGAQAARLGDSVMEMA